ncbi:ribosomal protein [Oryctes borbonicus]|uniref:Ribosomal protein n=1 Tax=Oryctes borbonicus TaxID=1629725 RepID=A0A0T6AUJ1_9SCAR|nr:ribosomal protein [Oryctes borbonicus]
MGKIKKVVSNDKKINKSDKSLKTIKKNKIVKKNRTTNLGAILSSSKNPPKKLKDVGINLPKSIKKVKTNTGKPAKSPKIKSKTIIAANKDATSPKKKKTAKLKEKPVDNGEVVMQIVSNNKLKKNKEPTLEKLKENKVKKPLKSKTPRFKVKTAQIFNQKPPKTENDDNLSINIQEDTVRSGIKALFKVVEEAKSNKTLFDDEIPIFLHFCLVKIGKTPSRTVRFQLKHSLLGDSGEICLITDDVRGHPRKEFEKTIEHYEDLLKEKAVTNIKKIIPLYQLKTEYSEFELKRKLVELYDMFLVDGKISKYTVKNLGKIFMEKRKLPIPVHMNVANLKDHFDFSVRKTSLNIHPHGDNFVVQIAHSDMTEDQIYENFEEACANLAKLIPGGWANIRLLNLKTPKSLAIPVYYTLKNPSGLPIPVIKPKRPKAFKKVSGELSTAYDREVEVLPSGDVKLKEAPLKKKNKRGNQSATTNGVCNDEPIESDEEYGRIYKQVEKLDKQVKSPNAQLKTKILKKQSLKMKAKQQRNKKSKGLNKSQAIASKKVKKTKTKIQIPNKGKKGDVKKNKGNVKKNKKLKNQATKVK